MSSQPTRKPDAAEFAALSFGIAALDLPLDRFLPQLKTSYTNQENVRLKWAIIHSAHYIALVSCGKAAPKTFREEYVQTISSVFLDLAERLREFIYPCALTDVTKSLGDVDRVYQRMLSLGRNITREQLLAHRQSAGKWFNLCMPVKYLELKSAMDRFVAKKVAGQYSDFPGLSGFGDDWALFVLNTWWGDCDFSNPIRKEEFVGLTRLSPYLFGPIEGFATKEFGVPSGEEGVPQS